jgi:hypothetical protein
VALVEGRRKATLHKREKRSTVPTCGDLGTWGSSVLSCEEKFGKVEEWQSVPYLLD